MTRAHRQLMTVGPDGTLSLKNVPFPAGEQVEVIVLSPDEQPGGTVADAERYPLRGLPYRFDDPFSPAVPEEDWDALR